MKKTLTICALFVGLLGVRTASAQTALSPYTDAEAYAVYSAILGDEWPVRVAKAKRLVIQTETVDYPHMGDGTNCLAPAKGKESIFDPVVAAYHKANKTPSLLQLKFGESFAYDLVSKDSIKRVFEATGLGGWGNFYAKYPDSGGVNSMSAVGFSADKTIVLVYLGHSCGSRCGGGRYHMLQKTNGTWTEIQWQDIACGWAS